MGPKSRLAWMSGAQSRACQRPLGAVCTENPQDVKPEAMGSGDTEFWPRRNQNRDSGSRVRHTGPPERRVWAARGPEAGGPAKGMQG